MEPKLLRHAISQRDDEGIVLAFEEKFVPHVGSLRVTITNHELSHITTDGCVRVHVDACTVPRNRTISEILRPDERFPISAVVLISTAALKHRATSCRDMEFRSS